MVTFSGDEGAVNAPLEVMAPALTDQVTAESVLPVPFTVALHCELAPGETVAGEQEIATEETCEETGCEGCDVEDLPPPQDAHKSIPAEQAMSNTAERALNSGLEDMRKLSIKKRRRSRIAHPAAAFTQMES